MATKQKKRRGRPVVNAMPERIDASPETITEEVLKMPPKKVWRYLRKESGAVNGNSVAS